MKKIVLLSFMVMCLPLAGMAQSFDDDLYYTPKDKGTSSEDRKTERTEEVKTTPEREGYVPAGAAFVVKIVKVMSVMWMNIIVGMIRVITHLQWRMILW